MAAMSGDHLSLLVLNSTKIFPDASIHRSIKAYVNKEDCRLDSFQCISASWWNSFMDGAARTSVLLGVHMVPACSLFISHVLFNDSGIYK